MTQRPLPASVTNYYTLTLGPLAPNGEALAEITITPAESDMQETRVLHVPAGLPGERVTIGVEEFTSTPPKRRRRHWRPRPPRVWISELHEPSPQRVTAPCPVFGVCGGCQLQHFDYAAQLLWKRARVETLLREVGNFDDQPLLPAVPCDQPWHYRNQMRFSVNREGQPGLTARGSHHVLPLRTCPIAHHRINQALDLLADQPNARPQVLIRCGAATDQMLIQPQPTPELAQRLREIGIALQAETMEEQLAGETFRIRPSSFFQTNTAQAEKMLHMVLGGLLPDQEPGTKPAPPRVLADAYCGVGTFALLLARHASKVIAIEESPSAIQDARWNLRNVENVDILKGKVEDLLPALSEQLTGLVIDPPRAGCQRVVLEALAQHPVTRLVYVSCDPTTLARDLDILCHQSSSYHLLSVQPLDMFPQTAHIECVAILERIHA